MKKYTPIFLVALFLFVFQVPKVHAQVSCNEAYYHSQSAAGNTVTVKVPGETGSTRDLFLYGSQGCQDMQLVITGSASDTVNIRGAKPNNSQCDTRTVHGGDTLVYTFWYLDSAGRRRSDYTPGWMPSNVGSHSGTWWKNCL